MAFPVADNYQGTLGAIVAGGRYSASAFWRNLSPGWTDITPSGTRPPFGILAFSGSALDSKGGKLYIQGGGHADYGGNEVWEYDLETRTAFVRHYAPDFTSIYNDSGLTPEQKYAALAPYIDNTNYPGAVMDNGNPVRPISRHTYGSLVWLPWLNVFTVGGNSTFSGTTPVNYWGNAWPNSPFDFWFYDPSTKQFTYRGSQLLNSSYTTNTRLHLHEGRQKCYGIGVNISNKATIYEYSPALNTWRILSQVGPASNLIGIIFTIDEQRDRLVALMKSSGDASYAAYQFSFGTETWSAIPTTGTAPATILPDARIIRSTKTDSLLLLNAYTDGMRKLNLSTGEWTVETVSGPTFDKPSGNWHWDKKRGLAILAYQSLSNGVRVWAYKE